MYGQGRRRAAAAGQQRAERCGAKMGKAPQTLCERACEHEIQKSARSDRRRAASLLVVVAVGGANQKLARRPARRGCRAVQCLSRRTAVRRRRDAGRGGWTDE